MRGSGEQRGRKRPQTEPETRKPHIVPAALAFPRRYSLESFLSLCLITLVSPLADHAKQAIFGESEGPSFYVDNIACPPPSNGTQSADALELECQLLNLRIPGGIKTRRLSQIDIFSVNSPEISIRASEKQIQVKVDQDLLRAYRVASFQLDSQMKPGSLLVITAFGRFGSEAAVGITIDGSNRQARQLAIAEGRILFLTEYWRQILLVAIAAIFSVRYRQLVIERLERR